MIDARERLIRAFHTVFPGIPLADVPELSVANTASWDSLNSLNLLQVIEEEFGIQIDFEELEELNSFAALGRYLSSERSAGESH